MFEMAAASETAGQNLATIYEWGLTFIHIFQAGGNPVLTAAARFFTLLGDPVAYLVILPILFWCVDEKRGFTLGVTVLLSNGINVAVKEALRVPRPFILDPTVQMIHAEGFSTPSGHSQNSAVLWPLLLRKPSTRPSFPVSRLVPALLLPSCIGLSRIYLGVHYPTDVLLGWTIGAVIVATALFAPKTAVFRKISDAVQKYTATSGRSLKSLKLGAAALVTIVLNATNNSDSSMGGAFFGFSAGYILLNEKTKTDTPQKHFSAETGSWAQKTLRLVAGVGVLGLLYAGLKKIFPGEESAYYTLFRFLRYGIIGFWASYGAPALFMKTGLAPQNIKEQPTSVS